MPAYAYLSVFECTQAQQLKARRREAEVKAATA